jgi:hypothetical protein
MIVVPSLPFHFHFGTLFRIPAQSFSPRLSSHLHFSATQRIENRTDPLLLLFCIFSALTSPNESGGAIRSRSSVTTLSCVFQNCSAVSGGAVDCQGNFVSNFSKFERIEGTGLNGLFELTDGSDSLGLYGNTVSRVFVGHSVMFTKHGGDAEIVGTNFTEAVSGTRHPGFELGGNKPIVVGSLLQNFAAETSLAGIVLWQCSGFLVTAVFRNFSIRKGGGDGALVCWLDGSLQTGEFVECTAVSMAKRGKLFACGASKAVIFRMCCFEVPRERCCNESPALKFEDCKFAVANCPVRTVPTMKQIAGHLMRGGHSEAPVFTILGFAGAAVVLGHFAWKILGATGLKQWRDLA